MYGAYHGPDCGDCASAGLGYVESKLNVGPLNGGDPMISYAPADWNGNGNGGGADAESAGAWWTAPVTTIAEAVADRISGPTSPYSPGTYPYGDPGYATPAYQPQVDPTAGAGRAAPSTATMLLWAAIGIGGLKLAGIF